MSLFYKIFPLFLTGIGIFFYFSLGQTLFLNMRPKLYILLNSLTTGLILTVSFLIGFLLEKNIKLNNLMRYQMQQ